MIIEDDVLEQAKIALSVVEPLLYTEDGIKLENYINGFSIHDFLYGVNGRSRFLEQLPDTGTYVSTLSHFRMLLILRVELRELTELVNHQFSAMDPDEDDVVDEEISVVYIPMSPEHTVTFLMILAMRVLAIQRAGERVKELQAQEE